MNYIFELPNKNRIVAKSADDFIIQFCKGHFLTDKLPINECMEQYAEMVRDNFPNLEIPTDTPGNFINALVRLRYIKWVR